MEEFEIIQNLESFTLDAGIGDLCHEVLLLISNKNAQIARLTSTTVQREGWVSVEANAKRYEWFKNNYLKFGNGDEDIARPIILFNSKWYGGHFNNIDDLDSAIDEAMIQASPTDTE